MEDPYVIREHSTEGPHVSREHRLTVAEPGEFQNFLLAVCAVQIKGKKK